MFPISFWQLLAVLGPVGMALGHLWAERVNQQSIPTLARIDAQSNPTMQWRLIERYGVRRFLANGRASVVHRDEYGTLFQRKMPSGEPIMVVEVVNATPKEDGTYEPYFLRVPPRIRTAKEAVAWTYGVEPSALDNLQAES
jgi:hypothetical protein